MTRETLKFTTQVVLTTTDLKRIIDKYPDECYGLVGRIKDPWVQTNVERAFYTFGILETDLVGEELKDKTMYWFNKLDEFNKGNVRDSGRLCLKVVPVRYSEDMSILEKGKVFLMLNPEYAGVRLGEYARMVRRVRGF